MKTIHTFRLIDDPCGQVLQMPMLAKILTVQNKNDQIVFWAEVVPGSLIVDRGFQVVDTGRQFETDGIYIGTVQIQDMVYHVYDLGELRK